MQPVRLELLQHMPIFGAIRDDALLFLLAQAREVSVAAGAYFFREGDPAQSMFVLESGSVAVFKSWEGRDFVLNQMEAGEIGRAHV